MSYLGLDSLNEQNLLDQATRLGVEGRDPGPGIFSGIGEAFVQGPASGLYKTLGAFNRGVVAPVAKTLVGPIDALKGDFALSNWIDDQVGRNRAVVDALKPDQRTSGVVAQVVHGLGELLPMGAMAVATGGAPALAALPEVAGAILGQEAVYQGIQDKLDPGTALGMGAITALSTWAGMKLPMNAGTYLEPLKSATGITIKEGIAANIMIGAAANPPIGMVTRGTTAAWLKANGYPDMAESYKILDKEAIAVDLIMGGGFGALAHYGPMVGERYQKWREGVGQGILDSDYDAALAMNNNIHLETGIAPGLPADPATREAHLQAVENTLRAVLAGEPIVIGDGITNGNWVENPSAEMARLENALAIARHMRQEWVDSQHDTHQTDLAALKAELDARGMDTSPLDLSGPARERQAAQAQAVDPAPPDVQIPGAITGRMGEIGVNGVYYPTQWVLVDAAQHQATIGKADNQFRNRRSPASEAQMESIANAPDIRQLLEAPLMDYGAPTMDRQGNIIGGNGRFEGLSRAYDRGTGNDYLGPLKERLAQYGIDPAAADGMKKPVLVRAFVNEMNTKKTAIMSNAGGGLRMSELELAKQDAESLSDIRGLVLNDNGSISMAANKARIMAWMADMPQTEINTIIDSKTGGLSIEGERRFQHAILYQAFGDGPTLTRLIESRDPEVRNVALALVRSGPTIAEARALIAAGDMYPIDITQDLTAAVEKLAELRRNGTKLAEYLLQNEMFAENQLSLEARKILVFLAENNRSVKAMSEMVNGFFDQVKAAGNPNAKGIFDMPPPAMGEILDLAIAATGKRIKNGELVETAPAADQKPTPLTPEERAAVGKAAHDALQQRVENDFDALRQEYNQLGEARGGQMVSGDVAKELSPEYNKDKTLAGEVHEAASEFAKKQYKHILAEPVPEGQEPVVLITGGGSGAGKSSGLHLVSGIADTANAIYDTTMASYPSSVAKIKEATDAGRQVVIVYTYREPVEAFTNGVLTRAMKEGRTIPMGVHISSHIEAQNTVRRLAETYKDNPHVTIIAIDNSRGFGNAAVVPLDSIPRNDNTAIRKGVLDELQKAHDSGAISDAVFAATKSDAPHENAAQRVDGSVGQGTGGKPEPQRPDPREPAGGVQELVDRLLPADQLDRLPADRRGELQNIYRKALETKPAFDEVGGQIARDIGGEYKPGPIKGAKRAISKIIDDYGNDPTRIKDIVRATIVVDNSDRAAAAMAEIRNRMNVQDKGFRNLLDPSVDPVDGYRDAKMNIQFNGQIVEMQISIPEIIAVKKVMHVEYEERAAIERASDGRERTPEEKARVAELNAKMKAAYDPAWAEVTSRLKASEEMGAPLRRAEEELNTRGGETSQAAQENLTPGMLPNDTGMPSTSKSSTSDGMTNSDIAGSSSRIVAGDAESGKPNPLDAIGQAIADHPEMTVPIQTRPGGEPQVVPAAAALEIAEANDKKSQLDAKAFEVAITCMLRG